MPKKVLIVDADVDIWQSIGAFLGDKGYDVGYSSVFSDALEIIQTQIFELIIADMCWPKLDGVSFLAQLSKIQPEATIIAVSEFSDRELEQEAQRNGAFICLTKPVNENDLLQALNSAQSAEGKKTDSASFPGKNIEQTLLRGFTPDQQWDFRLIGAIKTYQVGDVIPMNEDIGTMIWVERGKLMVCYNDTPIECLGEGEFWGEQAFVNPGSTITYLVALDIVQLRYFSRKRMMEYFAYHDETLIKRYMINLIICLHTKWNKTISRLVQSIQPQGSNICEEANVPEF